MVLKYFYGHGIIIPLSEQARGGSKMSFTASRKRKSPLPIIALMFAFAPVLWLSFYVPVPILGILLLLFLFSYFGVILQIIGLILGVIALFIIIRRKGTDVFGIAFSIIAILAPFVWI